MLLAVITTALIIAGLGVSFRSGALIGRHGYNNRYNDAAGARRDHDG